MPQQVAPMLATPIQEVHTDETYVHEIMWNGYRTIAYVNNGHVVLQSRDGHNCTARYGPVVRELKKLHQNLVLDGVLCVMNEEDTQLVYYVFDILWKNGYNQMERPLLERKAIIKKLLKNNPDIRYSDHYKDGVQLLKLVRTMGQEGIISKKKDSTYQPGQRGDAWYKTKTTKT